MRPRGQLQIPRRLIPALMLLATGDAPDQLPPPATVRELERLGIASRGRVAAAAGDVVAVMTDARLVTSVERRTSDLPSRSTIWARSGTAVWGRPVNPDVYELRVIDPIELPLLLAQLTDVGRRPLPPFRGGLSVGCEARDAALSADHDSETAFGILISAGVDPKWADRLLIAHDHRRAEWTVSSVWSDQAGSHGVFEVTVLDAGAAGYWHVETGDDGTVRYTVGSLETVMRLLRRCVPDWCAAPA